MMWREKQCKNSIKINIKSFQTNSEVMQASQHKVIDTILPSQECQLSWLKPDQSVVVLKHSVLQPDAAQHGHCALHWLKQVKAKINRHRVFSTNGLGSSIMQQYNSFETLK